MRRGLARRTAPKRKPARQWRGARRWRWQRDADSAREKQIAAMLRGGHPLDSARFLVNASSIEAAEEWADAAGE